MDRKERCQERVQCTKRNALVHEYQSSPLLQQLKPCMDMLAPLCNTHMGSLFYFIYFCKISFDYFFFSFDYYPYIFSRFGLDIYEYINAFLLFLFFVCYVPLKEHGYGDTNILKPASRGNLLQSSFPQPYSLWGGVMYICQECGSESLDKDKMSSNMIKIHPHWRHSSKRVKTLQEA